MKKHCPHGTIGVVGTGYVGSTFAFAAMMKNLAREIVLFDIHEKKAEGEAMDLDHGLMFVETGKVRSVSSMSELNNCDIIVITAGASQKKGQPRTDLVETNIGILKDIIKNLDKHARDAFLIIVSNPVDILTFAAKKLSSRPQEKIIGSGTVLDTARFRYLISEELNVSPHSVDGYILGEHGDTEFAAWSTVQVGGKSISEWKLSEQCMKQLEKLTRNAAYDIIERKGATAYGIALALTEIIEAILYDQRAILPVSTLVPSAYTKEQVCLSLPSVVSSKGVEETIEINLEIDEMAKLNASITALSELLSSIHKTYA